MIVPLKGNAKGFRITGVNKYEFPNHRRFYDEIRFRMTMNKGDRLRLIDFVELEPIPEPIVPPSGAMDLVRDFGAMADDDHDDLEPFVRALEECRRYRPHRTDRKCQRRIGFELGLGVRGMGEVRKGY